MLANRDVVATIAVKDLDAAARFYEGTLGLSRIPRDADDDAILYRSGSSAVLVYTSQFAGTNQATSASWGVGDDLDQVIDDLKSKGVAFERYDMPGVAREGDVHVMGNLRAAWFRDPDGNNLNLVNEELPH